MKYLRQSLFLLFISINVISLQASSEHSKSNVSLSNLASETTKKIYSDEEKNIAATKIQRSFHRFVSRKIAEREKLTQEKVAAINPYERIVVKSLGGIYIGTGWDYTDEMGEFYNKIFNSMKFKEENVQTLLVTFRYLTLEEFFIQFPVNWKYEKPHIVDDVFQIINDSGEAMRRKVILEADGNFDLRPFVDRMIAHTNLNEIQRMKIESYKKLSLQEIENKLKKANLSLEELEIKFKSEIDNDRAPENHDVYIKICKEIYKSKKRDEVIETYKNYTAQEMCEEIHELYKIIPISKLLRKIYQDVILFKQKAELTDYATQYNRIVDMNDFIKSSKRPTKALISITSGESSTK